MGNEKKINLLITITIIVVLVVAVASVTYSYFQFKYVYNASASASLGIDGDESFFFTSGDDLYLSPSEDNMMEGGSHYYSTTTSSVTITSGDGNLRTNSYYVALDINVNDYIYTTGDNTPELILTVFDGTGNEVTNIDGLTYYSNTNSLSGFDITGYTGIINVGGVYTISTDTYKKEDWVFTITVANLDSNQLLNASASIEGNVILSSSLYSGN